MFKRRAQYMLISQRFEFIFYPVIVSKGNTIFSSNQIAMVIPSTRKGNPNNNHLHGNSHGPHGDEVGLHLSRANYLQYHPRHGNDARIENPEPNKDWVSGNHIQVPENIPF